MQVDIISAIKCDYLVNYGYHVTTLRWRENEPDTKAHRNICCLGYFTKMK